ncbi:hypothetical protein ACFC3O_24785 [Streptomyces sp. NPDC056007]|uniref:hypothetical protein n=1 Tax=Streptomyces sp. NPDC056007 TaxID=3345678 RepID=UPI0035E2709D
MNAISALPPGAITNPAPSTGPRCAAGVRTGTAAVLSGHTGMAVWLDAFQRGSGPGQPEFPP